MGGDLPEFVEDMAADGDGLEIFGDGFETFVADRANGAGEFAAIYHFLRCLSLSISLCVIF